VVGQQTGSPLILADFFNVLSAIQLDDQKSRGAGEVGDKFADRKLAAKFDVINSSIAQSRPELLLRLRLTAPKFARAIVGNAARMAW
jgi:hypothetical protein